MSLYLEINYAKIIGSSLERWKIKKEYPFAGNCRCPVCLDSAKSKSKARFHILQKEDKLITYCFNCGYSKPFTFFLKTYYPNLYQEYIFEKYRKGVVTKVKASVEIPDETFRIAQDKSTKLDLELINDLSTNHPARVYVESRRLPDYPFMYAPEFFKFASQYNPDLEEYSRDEPRLIIPFFDREGSVFAFQGRDLSGKSNQKYITIVINTKIPKIFGIDRCNFKEDIIIVEGPIDSLFLKNSLASVNASLVSTANKLTKSLNKNLITLCFDNEPRNATIVKMYEDAIKSKYKTVIWPKNLDGIKDINDLILNGYDPEKIIRKNTYSGLSAQLEFQSWKKV